MANIINAITSGAGGLSTSADSSGILNIQSAGTTVAAIASTGMAVTGTSSVSGDLSFNSGYGSAAVAYGCRAWVNFNGTGTPVIRASGNVTSITDNGTGDYTINFTNALVDANYSVVAMGISYQSGGGGGDASIQVRNTTSSDFSGPPDMSTTNVRILSSTTFGVYYDRSYVGVAIFR